MRGVMPAVPRVELERSEVVRPEPAVPHAGERDARDPPGTSQRLGRQHHRAADLLEEMPPDEAADILGGTPDEKSAAIGTYISYCGRYEVNGDRLRHHVELSLFPNWTGVTQERIVRVEGDTLRISTPPLLIKGKEQISHLVWKRARGA